MYLEVGDRLLVTEHAGDPVSRVCRILSIADSEEQPTYVVLRYDTGAEEILVPDADVEVRVLTPAPV